MKNRSKKYKYYVLVFILLLFSGPMIFPIMVDLIFIFDIGGLMLLSTSLIFGLKLYGAKISAMSARIFSGAYFFYMKLLKNKSDISR